MKLSILTPTYNRGELLKQLYNSIVKNLNDNMDVEWLIMNDGSIDETENIIKEFMKQNKFDIQYYSQENRGKMNAINELIPYATGDLIIECDSDDYFKDNAFKIIKNTYLQMDENTYALCYLKYDQNECNIGNLFKEKETKMFDLYFKQLENGEKAVVFNANIRKQFSYELEKNKKFITEARMYHKMDLQYNIKCFNEPILICEYQDGGYSKNITEVFKSCPNGYYEYFKEIFDMDFNKIKFKKRIYIIKHYILFSILVKRKFIETLRYVKGNMNKVIFILAYIPGKVLTNIRFK